MSDSICFKISKSMLKDGGEYKKGSMKKIFGLLTTLLLLNGCAESVALLGPSVGGASSGKMFQSSLNTAISYGVKKQTGKTPFEHALAYAEEKNPEKKKEPCLSFLEKTNSEICLFKIVQNSDLVLSIKEIQVSFFFSGFFSSAYART